MAKLKGENQIKLFRKIANQLASKISQIEGIEGIVFTGGLTRGFADKYSDIDITVFINRNDDKLKKQIQNLNAQTQKHHNIDLDLEIHPLEEFKKRKWNEVSRWEFSHAKIFFDPKNEIRKTFTEKAKVPNDFWIKRIAVNREYLKWYSCPPKKDVGTVAEAWIERGDLVSAHYCLNYSVELLITLIFALNKEFMPAPKWRLHYLNQLKWQPKNSKNLMKEALIVNNFSKKDYARRIQAIQKMWKEITPKIKKETGQTLEQLSKYYVKEILHQTPSSELTVG